MKKILVLTLSVLLTLQLLVLPAYAYGSDLKADYPNNYPYIMNSASVKYAQQMSYWYMTYANGRVYIYGMTVEAHVSVYMVRENNSNTLYYFGAPEGLKTSITALKAYSYNDPCSSFTSDTVDEFHGDVYDNRYISTTAQGVLADGNIPVFTSEEALLAYRETGDLSGCLNPEYAPKDWGAPEFKGVSQIDDSYRFYFLAPATVQDLLNYKTPPGLVAGLVINFHDSTGNSIRNS